MSKREDALHYADQKNKELENDIMQRDEDIANLNEQIFKLNEQNLDLKFEKETFDLKKARLETRIKDLEDYKLKASAYSA